MSLLYLNSDPREALSEKVFYHISLDRVLSHICPDTKKRAEFAEILSRPLINAGEIGYRQAILRDLERERGMLEELSSLFLRFCDLYEDYRALSREKLRLSSSGNSTLEAAKNLLQSEALCLRRAFLFLCSIRDLLTRTELRSEGLTALKTELEKHTAEPFLSQMNDLLSSLESFKTSGAVAMLVSLDGAGKVEGLELIEPGRVKITDPELKRGTFSRLFRKEEPEYPCERVIPRPTDDREAVMSAAVRSLSANLRDCADALFGKFTPIARELRFYEIAIKYIDLMRELELPLCFPNFGEATEISSLYDIFLPFSRRNSRDVVPNDLKIPEKCGGILLFGENGSGKTVFLRSLTTAQIFAQAGLPIAARSAKMQLRSAILTQFSEGEKEFEAGNEAGRFEQEVRELAAIVDSAREGALVLLNETFQTTAYAEGARGLADILKYFAKNGITFIAVTHLHELGGLFAPGEVARMRTAKGFKVDS